MKLNSTKDDLKQILSFLAFTAKQKEIYFIYCSNYEGEHFVDVFLEEGAVKEKVIKLNKVYEMCDDLNYIYKTIILNNIWIY